MTMTASKVYGGEREDRFTGAIESQTSKLPSTAYLGLAIAWGHWLGFVFTAFAVVTEGVRIRKEEAVLEKAFGEAWRKYRRSTWF